MRAADEEVDLAGRILLLASCFVLVACTAIADPTTSTTTEPPDDVSTSTTALAITTTTPTNDTSSSTTASTTSSSTTSTILRQITVDPDLPEAMSGSTIPWSAVGAGWHVALYETDTADPSGPGDYRDGPAVLFLVAPDGTLYEAFSWPGEIFAGPLLDVRLDGTAALVAVGMGADTVRYEEVDIVAGTSAVVLERSWPEVSFGNSPYVMSFTRPTGTNHVLYESDGVTERIIRRSGGVTVATLFEQGYVEGPNHLTWLYDYGGTSAVIGHLAGMTVVTNDGTLVRDLWVPPDRTCEPVRWWDADTILATCRGGPAVAPHEYYHQLWFIETDGTAGSPLTMPPAAADVVDFGFVDGWFRSAGELVEWRGDCGAASVRWWDGAEGVPYGVSFPGADGYDMLGIHGVAMGVYAWQGCGQDVGYLYSVNTEDLTPTLLLGPAGRARGVTSAFGLVELYP